VDNLVQHKYDQNKCKIINNQDQANMILSHLNNKKNH